MRSASGGKIDTNGNERGEINDSNSFNCEGK